MALNVRCGECGGSYITPDVYTGDWSKVKNPYLRRIVKGPMISNPCTCAEEWEKEHGEGKEEHEELIDGVVERVIKRIVNELRR